MSRTRLRQLIDSMRRTPLHPQWLMQGRRVDPGLKACRGVVLDIGAASRWLEAELIEAAHYVSLDYPATAVGLYGARPHIFGDAARLPFRNSSIDAVACFEVMEHVARPEQVLSEIERVLKPGGSAYFSMPFLYPVHDSPHDYQRWTAHGWYVNARRAGFSQVAVNRLGHPLHAAAVLASLALVGPLQSGGRLSKFLRLPMTALAIPAINLLAFAAAKLWPDWDAMALGHTVVVTKSSDSGQS